MKKSSLFLIACAFVLGLAASADARAEGVMFHWPLVPGPSGYLGPVPRGPASTQRTVQTPRQAPAARPATSPKSRQWPVTPGEPDETGRIRPTIQAERDGDGKLLPTRPSR